MLRAPALLPRHLASALVRTPSPPSVALPAETPYAAAATVAEKEAIVTQWGAAMATNFNTRRQLWGAWQRRMRHPRDLSSVRRLLPPPVFPLTSPSVPLHPWPQPALFLP